MQSEQTQIDCKRNNYQREKKFIISSNNVFMVLSTFTMNTQIDNIKFN